MSASETNLLLERQLLLQFGDRLKRLRKAQALGTVEVAASAGISRNTLRAVEAGDPAPAMGTYLRVMSVLGIGGDLALLAGDTLHPAPAGSAAARSRRAAPTVRMFSGQISQPAAAVRWLAGYLYALSRVPKPPVLT